jgi:hypothetical protein
VAVERCELLRLDLPFAVELRASRAVDVLTEDGERLVSTLLGAAVPSTR